MNRKNILLRRVRDVQQYLAIGAEILMLIAFFVSGVDASVGGAMADNFWIKLGWAIVFGLSIDTLFVLSWVRVRQIGLHLHLLWAIPLALGLSFIVFQPVAIQLLQQSLSINFNQALSYLGINIVILVYARSLVAVCLGAILALTNVESEQVQAPVRPKRTLLLWQHLLDKYAPIEQEGANTPQPLQRTPLTVVKPQKADTHEQAIRTLLEYDHTLSVRSLAKHVGCTPSTADKWKRRIMSEETSLEATGGT